MPNGTLIWHSGSTCNVCDEDDRRNAALLWVNATWENTACWPVACAIRLTTRVDGHGYFFTDNGRDWEGRTTLERSSTS